MIAYVDASVLLRIALGQADALREWDEVDHGVSSVLVRTECLRSLDRIRLRSTVSDADIASRRASVISILATFELVSVSGAVLERASQPMPTQLGTLDAIHLATALLWQGATGQEVVMATHGAALATGARAHGLVVMGS